MEEDKKLKTEEWHGRCSQRFRCKNCKKLHVWTNCHSKPGKRLVAADRIIICACGVKHYR